MDDAALGLKDSRWGAAGCPALAWVALCGRQGKMGGLKPWFLCWLFLAAPAISHGGGPWSWLNPDISALEAGITEQTRRIEGLPAMPAPQPLEHAGFHSGFAPKEDSVRWVQVDLGEEREIDAVAVVPAMLGSRQAYGLPRRFRIDASNDPWFGESVTLLDRTEEDRHAHAAPCLVSMPGTRARYVRFTATRLAAQPGLEKRFIFCLGELLVFSGGRNLALHAEVLAPNSVETLPTWSPRHLVDGAHALGPPVRPDEVQGNGWHGEIARQAEAAQWVEVDLGAPQAPDEIRLIPAHPRDYPERPGFGFPVRFKVEADGRTLFDSMGAEFASPGDMPVSWRTPGLRAQRLRVTATRLWERSGDFVFALAELQAFAGRTNFALGAAVTSSGDTLTASWSPRHLVDGRSSTGVLLAEDTWLEGLSQRHELEALLALALHQHVHARGKAVTRAVGMAMAALVLAVVMAWRMSRQARLARRQEIDVLRQRISRDLHDEIGSHLGSIRLMSELALREDQGNEPLQEIHRLAGEAAESMRGIIWLVREGDAPRLTSLVEALRQSAAALLKGVGWQLEVCEGGEDPSITASLEFHRQVFLLFREAVHNIARHARASSVRIEAGWRDRRFILRIEDDGCGFDLEAVSAGDGLANLRHRAAALGGSLDISSEPGSGTRIFLNAPIS